MKTLVLERGPIPEQPEEAIRQLVATSESTRRLLWQVPAVTAAGVLIVWAAAWLLFGKRLDGELFVAVWMVPFEILVVCARPYLLVERGMKSSGLLHSLDYGSRRAVHALFTAIQHSAIAVLVIGLCQIGALAVLAPNLGRFSAPLWFYVLLAAGALLFAAFFVVTPVQIIRLARRVQAETAQATLQAS